MYKHSEKNSSVQITVRAHLPDGPYIFQVRGKIARTLKALHNVGSNGITALDVSNTWALRLSAYVHRLRREHNLDINTVKEEQPDGWHGRYILNIPIDIID